MPTNPFTMNLLAPLLLLLLHISPTAPYLTPPASAAGVVLQNPYYGHGASFGAANDMILDRPFYTGVFKYLQPQLFSDLESGSWAPTTATGKVRIYGRVLTRMHTCRSPRRTYLAAHNTTSHLRGVGHTRAESPALPHHAHSLISHTFFTLSVTIAPIRLLCLIAPTLSPSLDLLTFTLLTRSSACSRIAIRAMWCSPTTRRQTGSCCPCSRTTRW